MPEETPAILLQNLARIARTRLGEVLASHGIHPGQDSLLLALWSEPGLKPGALAERLQVEPATITRMISRLERGGLVRRERDPDDGRAWRITATDRSRLLEPVVRQAWLHLDQLCLETLGPEDSAQLLTMLRRLNSALLKQSLRRD